MHFSTSPSLSPAAVMLMATLAPSTLGVHAAGSRVISTRGQCLPAHDYTVVANDSCRTISQAQSVSTADIIALNCLNLEGTNLIANTTIKIPGCCSTYTVKPGDTCASVVASTANSTSSAGNLTLADFYAFNPLINNPNCTNLIAGDNVCTTAPQGTPFSRPDCPLRTAPPPRVQTRLHRPKGRSNPKGLFICVWRVAMGKGENLA